MQIQVIFPNVGSLVIYKLLILTRQLITLMCD